MKKDQAYELLDTLRTEFYRNWTVARPAKEVREYSREINWTLQVVQQNNLSRQFHFPPKLLEIALEEDLEVSVDATDERVRITLDNDEADKLELTEEEKRRKELKMAIRSEFDLDRTVVETLAEEFDSVDEIIMASREELTEIPGIGERRASQVLYRHSTALRQRIKETNSRTIPVVEDEDGVLRLPEEFEDEEYIPKEQ